MEPKVLEEELGKRWTVTFGERLKRVGQSRRKESILWGPCSSLGRELDPVRVVSESSYFSAINR